MNPLFEFTRACTACPLHAGCKGAVPADGNIANRIMFIGEAPGKNEDKTGLPFQGDAGLVLNYLLAQNVIDRDLVWVTNAVKCRPSKTNRTPRPDEAAFCAATWLSTEINMVRPQYVVTLGKVATALVLDNQDITMESLHGRPIQNVETPWGYTIPWLMPAYHPAAAMHNPALYLDVEDDFRNIARLVRGIDPDTITPDDAYPLPDYRELHSVSEVLAVTRNPIVAVDTETEGLNGKLWSVQLSNAQGSGYLVKPELWQTVPEPFTPDTLVIFHNSMYDAQYIKPPRFTDTMVMAYLLGYPQGLKALSSRYSGMQMEDLDEFLLPAEETLLAAYVSSVLEEPLRIPVSEPIVEERWDKKSARRVEHLKKPVRLKTKLAKMVTNSMSGKKSYRESFKALHEQEIKALAGVFGPVPEATIADVPYDQALWYSCRDADATMRVYNLLNPMIDQMGLRFILDYIDLPILPIALEMQQNGLPANPEVFQSLTREIRSRMNLLETNLHYLAGNALHKPNPHAFNPNSTMQRAQIFYGSSADGYLGLKPSRYTEGGAPSTTTVELRKIVHPDALPLIEPLCEYIEDLKLVSTYTAPLAKLAESGRVRYSIRTTRTATGRLSTFDPNVMSIPVRSELGRRVRSGFEATDGWLLVGIDFSQIEMRVAAHVTNCQSMIEIMRQGRDIHTETTLAIFGVPLDQARDPKFRVPTKILNFGVMYGMTSRGLLDALREAGIDNWTTLMADEFIANYFRLRPEIKQWQSGLLSEATRNGYVSDMFGRIRRVPELRSPIRRVKAEGERNTVNMPIQSGAQGIIKRAMANIWSRYYPAWNDFAHWLLQIHDELIFEVRADMVPVVEAAFAYEMENAIRLSVPLEVSVHHGKNWMELK